MCTASMAVTSDADAGEASVVDHAVIDVPSSISNESTALGHDPESNSDVSTVGLKRSH